MRAQAAANWPFASQERQRSGRAGAAVALAPRDVLVTACGWSGCALHEHIGRPLIGLRPMRSDPRRVSPCYSLPAGRGGGSFVRRCGGSSLTQADAVCQDTSPRSRHRLTSFQPLAAFQSDRHLFLAEGRVAKATLCGPTVHPPSGCCQACLCLADWVLGNPSPETHSRELTSHEQEPRPFCGASLRCD